MRMRHFALSILHQISLDILKQEICKKNGSHQLEWLSLQNFSSRIYAVAMELTLFYCHWFAMGPKEMHSTGSN